MTCSSLSFSPCSIFSFQAWVVLACFCPLGFQNLIGCKLERKTEQNEIKKTFKINSMETNIVLKKENNLWKSRKTQLSSIWLKRRKPSYHLFKKCFNICFQIWVNFLYNIIFLFPYFNGKFRSWLSSKIGSSIDKCKFLMHD